MVALRPELQQNMIFNLSLLVLCFNQIFAQNTDYDDQGSRSGNNNNDCYQHEDFPEPSECCTRPLWVNQYLIKPCRYEASEVENYRNDIESCSASCGMYKFYMSIINDRVQNVRLYKPSKLRDYGDVQWRQAIASALKVCKSRITTRIGRTVREGKEMEECGKANDIFTDCLDSQLFLQCPERVFIRNSGCDLVKEHLAKGCPFRSLSDQQGERRTRNNDGYSNNRNNNNNNYDNQQQGSGRSGNQQPSTRGGNNNDGFDSV